MIHPSSGNVFADLGVHNAEELLAEADLTIRTTEMSSDRKYRTSDGQEVVLTLWSGEEEKVGLSWKVWGAVDAIYASGDPEYLGTIPISEILDEVRNAGRQESLG